jgi:hypothetical protein
VRIGYIGNFEPSHSTENHVAATLEAMGHLVVRFQEVGAAAIPADRVLAYLHTLDLLLWTRTPPGLRGDAVSLLASARRMGVPTVAYHLDLYAGLHRAVDVGREPWWTCDLVVTADGGSDDFWQANKVRHRWLPPAVYEAEAFMAEPVRAGDATEYRYDVVFTGQYHYHPEWKYRQRLIDFLSWRYGSRFHRFPMPGQHAVRGAALNRLYADTKVVVGDSLCLGFTHPRYWSDRVPEVTGRGGFLVMPRITGLEELYRDGVELAYYDYDDFDGLAAVVDRYLDDRSDREAIRQAGHAATLRHSTYRHRMETLLSWVAEGL